MHQIDLPKEYGVHTTFNVMDLTPFAGNEDEEAEACALKTNLHQEGGDDGRRPSSGPTTRSMARKIQEDWNSATNGTDTDTDIDTTWTRTRRYIKSLKCWTRGHKSIYYIIMNYIN